MIIMRSGEIIKSPSAGRIYRTVVTLERAANRPRAIAARIDLDAAEAPTIQFLQLRPLK
jgi:hypothetical protein